MKKFILSVKIVLFLMACSSCGQRDSGKKTPSADIYSAEVAFQDSVKDLGTLQKRKEPYTCKFRYTNEGNVPAVVLNAAPSCRCTSVSYSKEPLPVGKADSIVILFDSTESGKGHFNKTVKIRFNSERMHTLRITGAVE